MDKGESGFFGKQTRWNALVGAFALLFSIIMMSHPPNGRAASPTIMHIFGGSDGEYPYGSLVSDGAALYGMTNAGGSTSQGVIFKINPDGTGYTLLHSFGTIANDGLFPRGSLVLSGSTLYGMTFGGGASNQGAVFKINTDGTGYAILHQFAGGANDGSDPYGSLVVSGSTLYGITSAGGSAGMGTVFSLGTGGGQIVILHSFQDGSVANDGSQPEGNSLVLSGSTLYGMTTAGGFDYPPGFGVIFKIDTDGANYKILHLFNDGTTANDGWNPADGRLLLSGSTLYGMAGGGGANDQGVIFQINTDGTNYTILHQFAGGPDDGGGPDGSLILSGSTLYGMTFGGGSAGNGTIFEIGAGGGQITILHSFGDGSVANDGGTPWGSLLLVGGALYGMTYQGGNQTNIYGLGTIFSLSGVAGGGLWQNATPTGNGWYYLSPFGAFNTNASPWIFHLTLGWLYPVGTSTDSIWFYDPQWDGHGGWWWTNMSVFPWIYSVTEGEWLYYDAKDSTLSVRWFFTGGGQASTH